MLGVRSAVANAQGFGQFYEKLLADGRKKHICEGCNRGLSGAELVEFEKFVSGPRAATRSVTDAWGGQCKRQQERAPAKLREETEELKQWEAQLANLKRLIPIEVAYNKLVLEDIPAAKKSATSYSDKLPGARTNAEEVRFAFVRSVRCRLMVLCRPASERRRSRTSFRTSRSSAKWLETLCECTASARTLRAISSGSSQSSLLLDRPRRPTRFRRSWRSLVTRCELPFAVRVGWS